MVKAMRPFRDSQTPSWVPGPQTDVPAEPPSHRACPYALYNQYIYLIHSLSLSVDYHPSDTVFQISVLPFISSF